MNTQWIFDDYERHFEAEILDESPYEEPLYFSKDSWARARDGLYVKVRPGGDVSPWVGKFTYRFPGFRLISGLVSCPDPNHLLVLSCGAASYVTVNPPGCLAIPAVPAIEVFSAPTANCVFITDNNRIVAIDNSGIKWHSSSIVPDRLHIQGVDTDFIYVTGFDVSRQSVVERRVALSRGIVGADLKGQTGGKS